MLLKTILSVHVDVQASYLVGALVGMGSCVWYWFLGVRDSEVYACAVMMGAAGSLLLITSISITSDLIKEDTVSQGWLLCFPFLFY